MQARRFRSALTLRVVRVNNGIRRRAPWSDLIALTDPAGDTPGARGAGAEAASFGHRRNSVRPEKTSTRAMATSVFVHLKFTARLNGSVLFCPAVPAHTGLLLITSGKPAWNFFSPRPCSMASRTFSFVTEASAAPLHAVVIPAQTPCHGRRLIAASTHSGCSADLRLLDDRSGAGAKTRRSCSTSPTLHPHAGLCPSLPVRNARSFNNGLSFIGTELHKSLFIPLFGQEPPGRDPRGPWTPGQHAWNTSILPRDPRIHARCVGVADAHH